MSMSMSKSMVDAIAVKAALIRVLLYLVSSLSPPHGPTTGQVLGVQRQKELVLGQGGSSRSLHLEEEPALADDITR